MGEREEEGEQEERPLASSLDRGRISGSTTTDEERGPNYLESSSSSSSKKLQHRQCKRRCIICCGCCTATLVILALVIVILALTVFQVKDPEVTMNSINVDGLSYRPPTTRLAGGAAINITLTVDLSIKNPNAGSFKFGNATTSISYGGRTVGEAQTPPGKAKARRTLRMNATVDVMADQLLGDLNLIGDLTSRALPISSYTQIGGRVILLNIIKRHLDIKLNCSMTVSLNSQRIQDLNCKRSVKL